MDEMNDILHEMKEVAQIDTCLRNLAKKSEHDIMAYIQMNERFRIRALNLIDRVYNSIGDINE